MPLPLAPPSGNPGRTAATRGRTRGEPPCRDATAGPCAGVVEQDADNLHRLALRPGTGEVVRDGQVPGQRGTFGQAPVPERAPRPAAEPRHKAEARIGRLAVRPHARPVPRGAWPRRVSPRACAAGASRAPPVPAGEQPVFRSGSPCGCRASRRRAARARRPPEPHGHVPCSRRPHRPGGERRALRRPLPRRPRPCGARPSAAPGAGPDRSASAAGRPRRG